VSVNPISPEVFQGGQMTDLPVFTGTLDGTELLEIVAAGAGQSIEADGINYSITSALLATLLEQFLTTSVILEDGDNNVIGNPYIVPVTISRVYINKTIAEPTYIRFGLAATYLVEPLIKDVAGTADALGNGIIIQFTGIENADGNTIVSIESPYGGYFFRPIAALNKWTLGSA
jgi:hypothetical protein